MKNIFVGNLSFGATEDAVRSLFEQYGSVERVSIITDRDIGQSRRFGFVEMSGNDQALRVPLNPSEATASLILVLERVRTPVKIAAAGSS